MFVTSELSIEVTDFDDSFFTCKLVLPYLFPPFQLGVDIEPFFL